jgi:hypothetical protein
MIKQKKTNRTKKSMEDDHKSPYLHRTAFHGMPNLMLLQRMQLQKNNAALTVAVDIELETLDQDKTEKLTIGPSDEDHIVVKGLGRALAKSMIRNWSQSSYNSLRKLDPILKATMESLRKLKSFQACVLHLAQRMRSERFIYTGAVLERELRRNYCQWTNGEPWWPGGARYTWQLIARLNLERLRVQEGQVLGMAHVHAFSCQMGAKVEAAQIAYADNLAWFVQRLVPSQTVN